MPEIQEIRSSIRTAKLRLRDALPSSERSAASDLIARSFLDLARTSKWRMVHSYLSFRSEVDTTAIITALMLDGVQVIVPHVEADGLLSHHELLNIDDLQTGAYGLPHPSRNEFGALDSLQAVILPLAAFDRTGNRLGYGKGFYDRFLATLSQDAQRVGLAFAVQEADTIPAMTHDQKLDMIITEREIIETTTRY